jgi:RNA recognition motif-containing protein
VYVKNLPMTVTASQLEEEFAKFGPVKPNGVIVKSQKVIMIRLLIHCIWSVIAPSYNNILFICGFFPVYCVLLSKAEKLVIVIC